MAVRVVGVVGGGIVGLAVAREVTLRLPGTRVVVLEKERRVGAHQTGHNSGVVHAGIYYPPGSLKARLCRDGAGLMRDYCSERRLPYAECGKLVVAVHPAELPRLDRLFETATANGVPGLRRLAGAEIADVEPYAAGLAALHSLRTAVTDFARVAEALAADVAASGGQVRLGTKVTRVDRRGGRVVVGTSRTGATATDAGAGGEVVVDRLVVCAGLQSDRVARLAGDGRSPHIVPFRGEYLSVRPGSRHLVRGLIYPVPDPHYPFLGVHFTRRVDGQVEIGPNAVLALAREGYRRTSVSARDIREMASWPGAWRLAARHWRTGVRELAGSLSTAAYLRDARRYVPAITPADVRRGRTGVRAQAVDRDGSLVDDFRVHSAGGVTAVRNAPSPAATSSLAIARYVVDSLLADR